MKFSPDVLDRHRFGSGEGVHPYLRRLKSLSGNSFHHNLSLLSSIPARLASAFYYPRVFGNFGPRSLMWSPLLVQNPQFMHIGSGVSIRNGVRMQSIQTNPEKIPFLRIGDGTMIEQFVHIICHNRVIIGSNVAIAPMCGIVDATHPWMEFPEITNPGAHLMDDDSFVEIGDGTFVGMGTVILPNVRIGKKCYIGANSVVISDIPDCSMAVGTPAKVIRTHEASSALKSVRV
jgi:acetyltransferase-like isoleucine patch superfamily enzyme